MLLFLRHRHVLDVEVIQSICREAREVEFYGDITLCNVCFGYGNCLLYACNVIRIARVPNRRTAKLCADRCSGRYIYSYRLYVLDAVLEIGTVDVVYLIASHGK